MNLKVCPRGVNQFKFFDIPHFWPRHNGTVKSKYPILLHKDCETHTDINWTESTLWCSLSNSFSWGIYPTLNVQYREQNVWLWNILRDLSMIPALYFCDFHQQIFSKKKLFSKIPIGYDKQDMQDNKTLPFETILLFLLLGHQNFQNAMIYFFQNYTHFYCTL